MLQSLRDRHVVMRDGRYENAPADDPGAIPLTAVPEAQPVVTLELHQSELGQHTLDELLWAFAKSSGNRPRLIHRLKPASN